MTEVLPLEPPLRPFFPSDRGLGRLIVKRLDPILLVLLDYSYRSIEVPPTSEEARRLSLRVLVIACSLERSCQISAIHVQGGSGNEACLRTGNENRPILAGHEPVDRVYFNLIRLATAESHQYRLPQFETVLVRMADAMRAKFK
jgi:hypothetical protein